MVVCFCFLILFCFALDVWINTNCRYKFGLKLPYKCGVIPLTQSSAGLHMVFSPKFTVFNTPLERASGGSGAKIFQVLISPKQRVSGGKNIT